MIFSLSLISIWTGDAFNLPYLLDLRPRSDFNAQNGMQKLAGLCLGTMEGPQINFIVPGEAHANVGIGDYEDEEDEIKGRHARLIKLSGLVSLDSRMTVGLVVKGLCGCKTD